MAEKNFHALLAKGDAEIRRLREENARLEAENERLKAGGIAQLEAQNAALQEEVANLRAHMGVNGRKDALRTQLEAFKKQNALLMLKVEELSKK